jgi:hypothetical protein
MSQHLMLILQLDLEHGVGQSFHHYCHYLNRVFLRQTQFPLPPDLPSVRLGPSLLYRMAEIATRLKQ